jgi:hypothetical protein
MVRCPLTFWTWVSSYALIYILLSNYTNARSANTLLTGRITTNHTTETTITIKAVSTVLAIITLRMAGLLTEVVTLVAVIEETFRTRVPIGDFPARALIHITMGPHTAPREQISTTCNGVHRDQQAVAGSIALTQHIVMGLKFPIAHSLTMTHIHLELATIRNIPGRPAGISTTMSTTHNPNRIAKIIRPCQPRPAKVMKPLPQTRVGNSALLSSQRSRPLQLRSQYPILPSGCRSASQLLARPGQALIPATASPMNHCRDSNQNQELIAVTGTGDETGIETVEISGGLKISLIHGTEEMIAGSINGMIEDKENDPQTGPKTGRIAAVIRRQNCQEKHLLLSRNGSSLVLNHGPRFQRSLLMPNLCTSESRAMSL